MGEISICNSAGRDAVITTESVRRPLQVRWVDAECRQATHTRLLKTPIDRDTDALREKFGDLDQVGQAIIDDDPEVDLEHCGRFLRETSRMYIDRDRHIVHKVQLLEIVRNPDGSERERRPRKLFPPNIVGEIPLRWSGVYVKKEEAARKFVFAGKMQLVHTNGLTYDFLHGMAKELEKEDSLMLLGAGPKSNQPLILRRGGSPYRGFLEGRTQEGKYCLLLHLSNMELKSPQPNTSDEASG